MWWLLNNPQVNGIYNLSTGTARSWNDLACAVYAALNVHPRIEYIDMPEGLKTSTSTLLRAASKN